MNIKNLCTATLLIGCIGILQYHSIQFWTDHVDAITGAGWSLLIEAAALWLWSSRYAARRAAGAIATVLLLVGPLYHVSEPLIQEWQANDRGAASASVRAGQLHAEIASLESALDQYLDNSAHRVGWAGRIDSTQTRLDEARAELAALTAAGAAVPQHTEWQAIAVAVLQAAAICLLQLVGVLAIGDLRQAGAEPRRETHRPQPKTSTHKSERKPPFRTAVVHTLRGPAA